MASEEFTVGDLVWAKMKSYPWWPSVVAQPRPDVKKPVGKKYFVEFFGSDTYAWISDEFIKPFEKYKEEHSSCNSPAFKAALNEVNQCLGSAESRLPKTKNGASKTNGVSQKKKSSQVNHDQVLKSIKSPSVKSILTNRKSESPVKAIKKTNKRRLSETSSTSSTSNKVAATDKKYDSIKSYLSPYLNWPSVSEPVNDRLYTPTSVVLKQPTIIEPSTCDLPDCEPLVFESKTHPQLDAADIKKFKIGFIGLGNIGTGIAKNLVCHGFKVSVWNRSSEKIKPFKESEFEVDVCKTPQDVVAASDITFSCVSTPTVAKEIVFGNCGVLKEMCDGKGYVEITSIDPETSKDIAEAITKKDGMYLEAPVLGTRAHSVDGKLIILAAGDNKLYDRCAPCFTAIGEHTFFLGEVGNASKMNLIISMMLGTSVACLVEAMSLAQKVNISQSNLLEIIELGPLRCPLFIEEAKAIIQGKKRVNTSLEHMQKDLQLALQLGDESSQSLPTTAAANEVFKYAKGSGFGTADMSSIYYAKQ